MSGRSAPPRADLTTGAALRRLFVSAGYDADHIQARLGTSDRALAEGPERPVHLRRLGDGDALAVLVRLFMLDALVPRDVADDRLGAEAVALLESAGLVVAEGDAGLDGTVRMVPHEHLLIASDRYAAGHPDHVAAVHGPSATCAHLTVRRHVDRALDMGTGNGIQAFLASQHARHVVATDVNERAIAFARCNAALNGIVNVEFRVGSFFEPVEGERFDLVVTNPPYVISPESEFLFRDGGLPRDSLSETVVRALPSHLTEGGFATAMISWIPDSDDVTARPVSWLDGSGCDALALLTRSDEPLSIAAQWNRDSRGDPERYGAAVDRWIDYFEANRIRQISFGSVVVRRRTAPPGKRNWARALRLPVRTLDASGAQIERLFATHDALVASSDPMFVLDRRVKVVDGTVVEQQRRFLPSGWATAESTVTIGAGMRFSAGLDDLTTSLVLRLDGSRTVREALPAPDGTRSQEFLEEIGARVARAMLEAGFLEFVEP